ncbi:MAG: hypothetical protein LRY69_05435 [Gammaproteobacteria bacterium]|nr:hypothetical protein [Gammaproteobacteria bacterium]
MKTYSLSSAQKRLYYKVLLDSHDANLSITSAITICGEYVSDKLKSGIIQLFEQNPILRANFFFNKATHEILQQYSCDPVIISHRQEHLDADKIDEFIKKEAIKLQIKKK